MQIFFLGVAQEPNRNRKPEPFVRGTKGGTGTVKTAFQKPKPELCPSVKHCRTQRSAFARGSVRTENWNRPMSHDCTYLLRSAFLSWRGDTRFHCKFPESTTRESTKDDFSELPTTYHLARYHEIKATHKLVRNASLGNIPVTAIIKIFPRVLRYKWEACCNTNWRRTAIQMGGVLTLVPFPQSVGAPKAPQYKLEAYSNTNLRCIVILF